MGRHLAAVAMIACRRGNFSFQECINPLGGQLMRIVIRMSVVCVITNSAGESLLMAMASPTLFICAVSVDGGRAPAPCGHFSKAERGILVTT